MVIPARPLLIGAAAVVGGLVCVMIVVLVSIQNGGGDGLVRAALSAKLHRPVSFAHARLHLFSHAPTVTLTEVRVSSPSEITKGDLLLAKRITLNLSAGPLLLGRVELKAIAIEGATLHLVRLGHGRNNYTFGKGGSGKLLGGVASLSVSDSRWRMDDPDRHILLEGVLAHNPGRKIPLPLLMQGRGSVAEQGVSVTLHGAALNGRKTGAAWPLDLNVVDGAATLHLAGTAQAPFDFRGFDLQADSKGPNLAVLGALLRTEAPNSAEYALKAHAQRQGRVVKITNLAARLGDSDISGQITSDHSQPRRKVTAALHFGRLMAGDVSILASPPAPHALSRTTPGRTPGKSTSLGASKPFPLAALRKTDVALQLSAAKVDGYALPLHDLQANLQLDAGKLSIAPVSFRLPSGTVALDMTLDARRDTATGAVHAKLEGARLSTLRPKLKSVVDGDLNATVSLSASGESPGALLAGANGGAAFRLMNGRLQTAPAAVLGGDPLSIVPLALGKKGGMEPLRCAQGSFTARRGVFTADTLQIATLSGVAHGSGTIDMAHARLDLRLQGRPTRRFAVAAPPATISGPFAHPKVSVDKGGLVASGVAGAALAVVTAPILAIDHAPAALPPPCWAH